MAANAARSAPRYDVTLNQSDAELVEEIAWKLATQATGRPDDAEWVEAARNAWHEWPATLRKKLSEFRRDSGPDGSMLLRGLPVDSMGLPPTPAVNGSVQREPSLGAAVLLTVACDWATRRVPSGEERGPRPGRRPRSGDGGVPGQRRLHPADVPQRERLPRPPPRLRDAAVPAGRPHGRAGLRTACVRRVLPLLSDRTVDALWAPEFITAPPPSFNLSGPGEAAGPVLLGDPSTPTSGWTWRPPNPSPNAPPRPAGAPGPLRRHRDHPPPRTGRTGDRRQPRHRPRPHRVHPALRRHRPLAPAHLRTDRPAPLPRVAPGRRLRARRSATARLTGEAPAVKQE